MSVRLLLCIALGAGALAACGGDKPGCADPVAERIDPLSSQHLLPDAPEPAYLTNPPTSGAHRPGPLPDNVLSAPLAKSAQVAVLEAGHVLIQYRSKGDAAALRELAKGDVHVAPGRDLPAPVVATAWLYTLQCERVDKTALRSFIDAHTGKAPSH